MAQESTPPNVECVRCGRQAPAATGVPYGGQLGEEIRAKICADCWQEWEGMEIMVINELRLNFMDPGAQDALVQQMRQFLMLD